MARLTFTTELDRSFPFMGGEKPSKTQNLSVTPKLKLKYHGGRVRRWCDEMVLDTEQTAPGLLSSNLESCQGCYLYRKVTSNALHKSISSSRGSNPGETCSVRSSKPFREEIFDACRASISFGWILFRRGVHGSFRDEKRRSHGIKLACAGRTSMGLYRRVA